MNYKEYALRRKIGKVFYSIMSFLTTPLRKSYQSEGIVFRLSEKKGKKEGRKAFVRRVFYALDKHGECYILDGMSTDYSHCFDIDSWKGIDRELLKNERWLKKNNLVVESVDSMGFMKEFNIPQWDKEKFKRYEIIKVTRGI